MEIAEILNVPVASFFDTPHVPGEDGGISVVDSEAAVQGRQVMVAFLRIKDPQKRTAALAYLRSLLDPESP